MKFVQSVLFSAFLITPVVADTPASEVLSIELNKLASQDNACTLSFVISNGSSQQIDKAVFETVLFDSNGQVHQLTLFDFGILPAGTPRVRQFVVPDVGCGDLRQILFNGIHSCEAASSTCAPLLNVSSRTEIEVLG
nr:hypothetical protein [Pseudaestuariivita rosea]